MWGVLMHTTKTIYAIQHIAFEDLGSLEDIFYQKGYRVRYFEAGVDDLTAALQYDGLVVILGGPIGAYEIEDYPFLKTELALLKTRLADQKPTLGICLGAQLIAAALDAPVYSGSVKEIGWSTLQLTSENSILAPLKDIPVLHWHGDTFDLPQNAQLLASSEHYTQQAFMVGHQVLGLQFHIEVEHETLERWLIGHACELKQANIDIPLLRQNNQKYALQLMLGAQQVIQRFLQSLEL